MSRPNQNVYDDPVRLLQTGQFQLAVQVCNQLIQRNPRDAKAYLFRGIALSQLSDRAQALASFLSAHALQPTDPEILGWAATSSLSQNQPAQAEKLGRKLVDLQPRNERAHFLVSNSLIGQGKFLEALDSLNRAIELSPKNPEFVAAKAQVLGQLSWGSQAIEWYERAIAVTGRKELEIELGHILLQEGQIERAVEVAERSEKVGLPSPAERLFYAQAFTEAQRFEQAETYWNLVRGSASESYFLARANSEIYAGRLDVAETVLREGMEEVPNSGSIYSRFASIRKLDSQDIDLIEKMESLARSTKLSDPQKRDLNYGLGKAHFDLREYESSIRHYDEANLLAYRESPVTRSFDPTAWKSYIDALIRYFTREKVKVLAAQQISASELPLFIVGMIRSGTTLTEQILSRHSQIFGGGETTFWADHRNEIFNHSTRWFDEGSAKRHSKQYLKMLDRAPTPVRYVSEKNPSNVILTSLLYSIYPRAKFIHIHRHPVDNMLSIWMTPLTTGLPFVYDRKNIVAAFRENRRLEKHLLETLPDSNYQVFKYESITSSPKETIESMLKFLDLPVEADCFSPQNNPRTVRTPSYFQARQPINANSQMRWKVFEPWLGPFAEFLE